VEYFYGDNVSDPAQGGYWEDTGFCAVISFTSSGRTSGIYFIYDFYQVDKCAAMNTDHKERNFDKQLWGLLPKSQARFSCAKVAKEENITNLAQDFQFQLSEVINHEVGLVRAVLTLQNIIIRAEIPVITAESSGVMKRALEAPDENDDSPTKKLHASSFTGTEPE
jgi:hypothetical protein